MPAPGPVAAAWSVGVGIGRLAGAVPLSRWPRVVYGLAWLTAAALALTADTALAAVGIRPHRYTD